MTWRQVLTAIIPRIWIGEGIRMLKEYFPTKNNNSNKNDKF